MNENKYIDKENIPNNLMNDIKKLEKFKSPQKEEDADCADDDLTSRIKIPLMRTNEKHQSTKILKFYEKITNRVPSEVAQVFASEINETAGSIIQLWHKYLQLIRSYPENVLKIMQDDYAKLFNKTFENLIFHKEIQGKLLNHRLNYAELHQNLVGHFRTDTFGKTIMSIPVNFL